MDAGGEDLRLPLRVFAILTLCAATLVPAGCSRTGPTPPVREKTTPDTTAAVAPLTTTITEEETPMQPSQTTTLTIVYDNNAPVTDGGDALRTAWGFSCLVETTGTVVLFDTGGDGPILLHNMQELGIDPASIDIVVLSHFHSDHTGGLAALLDACTPGSVFMPQAFPAEFKEQVSERTRVVEVTGPAEIAPGITSTGEMGSSIIEQGIVVQTADGPTLITGCAHPGIVEIATRMAEKDGLALVMGGFHLKDSSDAQIASVIAKLEQLGVARVAPTHCTGDRGRTLFAESFAERFVHVGLGSVIVIPETE